MIEQKSSGATRTHARAVAQRPSVRQMKTGTMAVSVLLVILCAALPSLSFAAESASSHYLPGAVTWFNPDSGTEMSIAPGARLGDFESESFAVGPGFIWIPGFGDGSLSVLGKWLHDFSAKNRFESDYITLTAAWKF